MPNLRKWNWILRFGSEPNSFRSRKSLLTRFLLSPRLFLTDPSTPPSTMMKSFALTESTLVEDFVVVAAPIDDDESYDCCEEYGPLASDERNDSVIPVILEVPETVTVLAADDQQLDPLEVGSLDSDLPAVVVVDPEQVTAAAVSSESVAPAVTATAPSPKASTLATKHSQLADRFEESVHAKLAKRHKKKNRRGRATSTAASIAMAQIASYRASATKKRMNARARGYNGMAMVACA